MKLVYHRYVVRPRIACRCPEHRVDDSWEIKRFVLHTTGVTFKPLPRSRVKRLRCWLGRLIGGDR